MAYAQPVPPGFWSVTMYDKNTSYTVANPINRYHLADYDTLKKNADGSITLYLQAANPGSEKESNWLPAGTAGTLLSSVPELRTKLPCIGRA